MKPATQRGRGKHRHARIDVLGRLTFAGFGNEAAVICECGAVQLAKVYPAKWKWSRWKPKRKP
jgi:hypothetical protein